MPLWLGPVSRMPEAASAILPGVEVRGSNILAASLAGIPGLLLTRTCFITADNPAFSAGDASFTLLFQVSPVRRTFTQFAGTRHTFREIYPGHPGWSVGMADDSRVRLTIEDASGQLSTLVATRPLPFYRPTHVAAVRDRARRELRIYLDGSLDAVTNDLTSADLGPANRLQLAYDNMGGGYFQGVLHRLVLYNRALDAHAVGQLFEHATQPSP
jgi:hypothetical protein